MPGRQAKLLLWNNKICENPRTQASAIFDLQSEFYIVLEDEGGGRSDGPIFWSSGFARHFTLKSWNVSFERFCNVVVVTGGQARKVERQEFRLNWAIPVSLSFPEQSLDSSRVTRSSFGISRHFKFSVFGEFSGWEEEEGGSDFLQFSYESFERRLSVNC